MTARTAAIVCRHEIPQKFPARQGIARLSAAARRAQTGAGLCFPVAWVDGRRLAERARLPATKYLMGDEGDTKISRSKSGEPTGATGERLCPYGTPARPPSSECRRPWLSQVPGWRGVCRGGCALSLTFLLTCGLSPDRLARDLQACTRRHHAYTLTVRGGTPIMQAFAARFRKTSAQHCPPTGCRFLIRPQILIRL